MGCQRSQLLIAVRQAGPLTTDADKQGLLWAAEWLLELRSTAEVRASFAELLENPLRLAALHALVDDTSATVPAFAAALAALGHRPTWIELRALTRAGRQLEPQLVNPGERLVRAGQPASGLWIVHQGELITRPAGRRAAAMDVLGPAEGLDRGVWLDSIYATRGAVVMYLPGDALAEMIEACPVAGPALGLGGARRRLASAATTSPPPF